MLIKADDDIFDVVQPGKFRYFRFPVPSDEDLSIDYVKVTLTSTNSHAIIAANISDSTG